MQSVNWSDQVNAFDSNGQKFGIQGSPSLTAVGNTAYMAWTGLSGTYIWFASIEANKPIWNPQTQVKGSNGTSFEADHTAPSITNIDDQQLFMCWKGKDSDAIYYSFYDIAANSWSNQVKASGQDGIPFSTQDSPYATVVNGTLLMAWSGSGNDGIWYSTYKTGTKEWASQIKAETSDGDSFHLQSSPAVASVKDAPFLAWNGQANDGIWYSAMNQKLLDQNWSVAQKAIGNESIAFNLVKSPALVTLPNTLFMTWNGITMDSLWYSFYDADTNQWVPQAKVKSESGELFGANDSSPGAAATSDHLLVSWNGIGKDGIWFTWGTPVG